MGAFDEGRGRRIDRRVVVLIFLVELLEMVEFAEHLIDDGCARVVAETGDEIDHAADFVTRVDAQVYRRRTPSPSVLIVSEVGRANRSCE